MSRESVKFIRFSAIQNYIYLKPQNPQQPLLKTLTL